MGMKPLGSKPETLATGGLLMMQRVDHIIEGSSFYLLMIPMRRDDELMAKQMLVLFLLFLCDGSNPRLSLIPINISSSATEGGGGDRSKGNSPFMSLNIQKAVH